ncbi:MAG: phosphoglycerate kinase [Acidobacteriota bacterium]
MNKISIRELDLNGKRVFLRVDFNVSMENGQVTDVSRIEAVLPTIELIRSKGGALILASHLGRPKGKRVDSLSLRPVAGKLSELLAARVEMAEDCSGAAVKKQARELEAGEVLLLENVRFHPGEEKNDPKFAKSLADLADLFINDAFGAAHRTHASVVGICKHFPVAAAGLLLEKELLCLSRLLSHPEPPFVAVVGGAKVAGKIELLANLLTKVDSLLIGGAMAYTLLRGQEIATGKSPVEEELIPIARDFLQSVRKSVVKLLLPLDHVTVPAGDFRAKPTTTPEAAIPEGQVGVDIGPRTVAAFRKEIQASKTILWNGPLGLFEQPPFDEGTRSVATAIAESPALTVVGGGDSVTAVRKFGLERGINHISTGGGAALEFLSGRPLPGVEALTDKK